MGLAASQARYLALTARKSDLEFQSQTINSRRIQLSYKTAEIAEEYSRGMNNQRIKINTSTTTDEKWTNLTFGNLYNAGYTVIGIGGKKLVPQPYTIENYTDEYTYEPASTDTTISTSEYDTWSKLTYTDENGKSQTYKDTLDDVCAAVKDSDGTTIKNYALNTKISQEQYDALPSEAKAKFKKSSTPERKTNYQVNKNYSGADIQNLLNSAKAEIVTQDFFDYLVNNYGYTYATGITANQYAEALENWQNNEDQCNPSGQKSTVDWQADETSTFKQASYTEDDAAVLAKYTADTAKVNAQDKILEAQEKNIETQHKAIETELESIQKVIQNNIEKTFKIFS